ncbi:MAG: SDR family oxidoreductase [Actinobacteria bacterium]|nr:SDR family oxidoreductase [Actinomycetota bacterium]
MRHYLVTGGAGFIGSNLIARLLESKDNKVTCMDNLLTGKKENINGFISNPNFNFIKCDIIKPFSIDDKLDYVINLACPASPMDYRKNPIETLEASSIGTRNMLEIARENKARFFHTSTSEVYGDPKEHPQKETYWGNVNSYGERSCYDEAKFRKLALIYYYKHDFRVDTGIIRIFNTYGPKMQPNDGRVVSTFIRQALKGEDLTIFGDGKQTRSFCYIEDQVDAQIKAIHSNIEGPINVGNPEEFTMIELAQKILKLTKSNSRMVFKKLPKDDPTQRCPDISKAKKLLNWEPKVKLEEGLKQTIIWFKGIGY